MGEAAIYPRGEFKIVKISPLGCIHGMKIAALFFLEFSDCIPKREISLSTRHENRPDQFVGFFFKVLRSAILVY